ncbi:MAG TPA: thiolase family protein [Nitriliruptorales bacterium]|nr:thiolase family protein [Nitriliruptorales bacterium]
MREAVIVEAVRTPMGRGKAGGRLHHVHPVDLLAETLRGLVERADVDASEVDDVIAGCVSQTGEQTFNIARNAVLAAGFPETVPGTTVDRQCGSSQQAAHFAAQGVIAGAYDVAIACGVESMSRVPMGSSLAGRDPFGPRLAGRYPGGLVPQGISAELIAATWGFTREQLDELALRSHRRAAAATGEGRFQREILPIKAPQADGGVEEVATDEGIRPDTDRERLASLRPAFHDEALAERFPQIRWVITAGNSSQITDGAAALLITTPEKAEQLGLTPRARFHTFALAGDDPVMMLTGVIPATRTALQRSGLGIDDIDLFEVNEAFAPVVLAWASDTGADLERVNVNGGAMALGHPLGASGARLMTTLLHAMEQRGARYGLQTMCEGGGMANATVLERL